MSTMLTGEQIEEERTPSDVFFFEHSFLLYLFPSLSALIYLLFLSDKNTFE